MAVDRQEIAELVDRLNAGGSMFGQCRKAARRLASMRSPRAVRGLTQAYVSGRDRQVTEIAAAAITGLDYQAGIDAACEVLIATGDERLAALLADAGHLPSDPDRRALLLFLTGRFEEYAELDFDGAMLAAAYRAADAELKARLAGRARTSARVEWVRAIAGARGQDQAAALSDSEWETLTGILIAAERWDELCRLVSSAPPVWGVQALRELARRRWRPADGSEAGFDELTASAARCSADLTECFIADESTTLTGHEKKVAALAVSPDGTLLATGCRGNRLLLWELPSGRLAQALDQGGGVGGRTMTDLLITPGGGVLVSASVSAVRLWRLPSEALAATLQTGAHEVQGAYQLVATADGRFLVGDCLGGVEIWRLPTGQRTAYVKTKAGMGRLAASPVDGGRVARSDHRGAISLSRLGNGDTVAVLSGHKGAVSGLAVTPDGELLVSGGADGTVRLWRLPWGDAIGVLSGRDGPVTDLAVTPDGGLLASGGADGTVRLWRLPSGASAGLFSGHEAGVSQLTVSADGGLLASGDLDGVVRLWYLPSGEAAGTVSGHDGRVTKLEFVPNSTMLASVGEEPTVRLWRFWHPGLRAASRTPLGELDPAQVARLPDAVRDERERAWAAMTVALVRWRRRHDIEVDAAYGVALPGAADIEVDLGTGEGA